MRSVRRDRRADGVCVAVLLAAATGLAVWFLVSDRVLFPFHTGVISPWKQSAPAWARDEPANFNVGDKHSIIYPDMTLTRAEFDAGHVPLWNPYNFAGLPHQANPLTATFYPPNVVFSWFDPLTAFGVSCALHLFLAAVFTLMFLRQIGIRPGCALLGAVGFALGGWMAVHIQHQYFVHTMIWLPAALFAIERIMRRGSRWALMLLAIAVAMMWLAGFIQTALINTYLIAAYTIVAALSAYRRSGRAKTAKPVALIAAFAALGLVIASVQIIPTVAFAREAGHRDISIENLKVDSLQPVTLLHLIMPDFFGNPSRQQSPVDDFFAQWLLGARPGQPFSNNYSERTFYVGGLLLLLAMIGLCLRRDRAIWTLGASSAVAVCCAMGTPLLNLVARLPGFDVGSPMRFVQIAAFSLPIICAAGLDRLLAMGNDPRPRVLRWVAIGGVVSIGPLMLVVLALWIAPTWSNRLFTDWLIAHGIDERLGYGSIALDQKYSAMLANTIKLRANLSAGALSLILAGAFVGMWARGGARAKTLLTAAFLIVVTELIWYGVPFNRPVRREQLYAETPGIRFLREHIGDGRIIRLGRGEEMTFFSPNAPMVYRLRDAQGFRALTPTSYLEFMRSIEPNPYDVGLPNIASPASLERPQIELARIRFAIASKPVPDCPWPQVYPPPGTSAEMVIYENPSPLARVFFVGSVHVLPRGATLDEFKRLAGTGTDNPFRSSVWLNELHEGMRTRYEVPRARPDIIEDRPGHLELSTAAAASDALLVIPDQFDAGWHARVAGDGDERPRQVPVLRADHTFMAVPIPAGTTRVFLDYRPKSLQWGGLFSGLALAFLLTVPLWRALAPGRAPLADGGNDSGGGI